MSIRTSTTRSLSHRSHHLEILLLLVSTLALYSPSSTCHAFAAGRFCSHGRSSGFFQTQRQQQQAHPSVLERNTILSMSTTPEDDDNKFGFGQRIESVKCLVVGGIVGSLALAPFAALHDLLLLGILAPIDTNGLAQWEFDNDMGSLQAALFAIVYRYCIRQDTNEQLNQGVVGSFVVTRTLSRIVVSPYCSAIVLNCKYFDMM
jgi:hypothetical protein